MRFCCQTEGIVWYNVVFAYNKTQQNCAFTMCGFFTTLWNFTTMYIKAQRMERKNTTKDNAIRSQLRSDISWILTRSPKRPVYVMVIFSRILFDDAILISGSQSFISGPQSYISGPQSFISGPQPFTLPPALYTIRALP